MSIHHIRIKNNVGHFVWLSERFWVQHCILSCFFHNIRSLLLLAWSLKFGCFVLITLVWSSTSNLIIFKQSIYEVTEQLFFIVLIVVIGSFRLTVHDVTIFGQYIWRHVIVNRLWQSLFFFQATRGSREQTVNNEKILGFILT